MCTSILYLRIRHVNQKKNWISLNKFPLFPDALIPVIETIFAVGAVAKRLVPGTAATAQGDPVPGLITGTGG
jgi:hypothetical protein